MKTALIYGTTGLTGGILLTKLLESKNYIKVKALTRKSLDIQHEKLEEIIYDFENPNPKLLTADDVFCCLGTTIRNAGSQTRFYQIDHDYVIDTAKHAFENGAVLFSLVSAVGANPKSRIFYNRVKGETENDIKKIGFKTIHIFRPSLLLGNRKEFRLFEKIAQIIMSALSFLIPVRHRGVKSTQLASVMHSFAQKKQDQQITIENAEIILYKSDSDE